MRLYDWKKQSLFISLTCHHQDDSSDSQNTCPFLCLPFQNSMKEREHWLPVHLPHLLNSGLAFEWNCVANTLFLGIQTFCLGTLHATSLSHMTLGKLNTVHQWHHLHTGGIYKLCPQRVFLRIMFLPWNCSIVKFL